MIEINPRPEISQELAAAAFGDRPQMWPLPSASDPQCLWLRAVVAGGQGRYASAFRDLAEIGRRPGAGRWSSLAHSAHGSFLRQLGWHGLARRWDGRALAVAGDDIEARCDALTGLAADALGIGRFAVAATLLDRLSQPEFVDADTDADGPVGRLAVRQQWVRAELAMVTGDGAAAVRHAREAVERAAAQPGQRHRIKSTVVLAAALCAAGDVEGARLVGAQALAQSADYGLIPLRWASACLLIDIGTVTVAPQQVRKLIEIRDICADQFSRNGGIWRFG